MLCGAVKDEICVSYRVEMFDGKIAYGVASDLHMATKWC